MRPSLKVARLASGPPSPSPPQTPTTTSPNTKFNQKAAVNGDGNDNGNGDGDANQNGYPLLRSNKKPHRKSHHSNIHPLGGTKFSYSRAPRPEEISPRSSESSEEESEPTASPPQSPLSEPPEVRKPMAQAAAAAASAATSSASIIVEANFAIEELGNLDPNDSDVDLLVLRPSEIEYPDSECSGSPSRGPPDMDPSVVSDFKHLDPFYDSDSDSPGGDGSGGDGGGGGGRNGIDEDEFERNLQRRRQERRIRRMKSGSISKRTISERGSDSDREDVLPYHDGGGGGASAEAGTATTTRRLRRKTDRHSMQFSGQYFERIEELKEPNSDDEIILDDAEVFARELPYWTLMDVDSE